MLLFYYIVIFLFYSIFWSYFIRREKIEAYLYLQYVGKIILLAPFWALLLYNIVSITVPPLIKLQEPTDFTQKIIIENNTKYYEQIVVYSRYTNTYDWTPVAEYVPEYSLTKPPNFSFVHTFPPRTADTLVFNADTAKYDRIYIENTAGFKFASDSTSYAIAFRMPSKPIKLYTSQLMYREIPALKPPLMPDLKYLILFLTALNGLVYHFFKHRKDDLINSRLRKILFYVFALLLFIITSYLIYSYGMNLYYSIMRYDVIDTVLNFDYLSLIDRINFNKFW